MMLSNYQMKVQVKNIAGTIKLIIPDSDTAVFPSGFDIGIAPGVITNRVKRIDLQAARITELAPGSIPNSVTHLFLRILTKDMTIPKSVTDLFIRDFSQSMVELVPATVVNLYIHVNNRSGAPTNRAHYLFYFHDQKIKKKYCEANKYDLKEQYTISPFNENLRVAKRVPKGQAPELATSQAITVGETYTDLMFDTDAVVIEFPDSIKGGIKPGSLDHLTKLCRISWGVNMTDLIEPGTIPKQCTALLLPASYKHSYDASQFRIGLWVYMHESNLEYATASSRKFNVWNETGITATPGFKWSRWGPKKSSCFDVYMCEIQRDNTVVAVPKTIVVASSKAIDAVVPKLVDTWVPKPINAVVPKPTDAVVTDPKDIVPILTADLISEIQASSLASAMPLMLRDGRELALVIKADMEKTGRERVLSEYAYVHDRSVFSPKPYGAKDFKGIMAKYLPSMRITVAANGDMYFRI